MSLFKRKKYPQGAADPDNDPALMNDVYAGPPEDVPFHKKQPRAGRVYAGPAPDANGDNEASRFKTVYAGPAPDPNGDDEASRFKTVYAGPDFFRRSPIQTVYAGPDMMNRSARKGSSDVPGAYVDEPVTEGVYMGPAPNPSAPFPGLYNNPLAQTDTGEAGSSAPASPGSRFCPECGALRIRGAFCPECGAKYPPEASGASEDPGTLL